MRDDMLKLMDGSKLPADSVLGLITLFTVPDEPVPGTKLSRAWASEGLDPTLIPDVRKPVHTFQQACRKVETRRQTNGSGHSEEIKVDEVLNGPDECIYQITRMVRDRANQVIDHPKAMKLVFDKAKAEAGDPDPIDVQPLDKAAFGALKGISDRIIDYYHKNLTKVPGQKVRNALRDYMKILGAENLRRKSGGVYFVPMSGADTLEALARVLEKLYGDDADLHTIPQPNTKAVAGMLSKHHAMNVVKECDEMIARISERLKSGTKVRRDLLTNLMQQRRELGARRKQYASILGTEQKTLAGHFEALDESIERLMEAAI